jgi:hypothetical protein
VLGQLQVKRCCRPSLPHLGHHVAAPLRTVELLGVAGVAGPRPKQHIWTHVVQRLYGANIQRGGSSELRSLRFTASRCTRPG